VVKVNYIPQETNDDLFPGKSGLHIWPKPDGWETRCYTNNPEGEWINGQASKFGIDASRMQTEGAGESKPVAPNDTPANKAMNRRVEFIKL